MGRVAVATDSNSGITQSKAVEMGIRVLPMPFFIDGEMYLEDITLTQEEFYQRLQDDSDISTSQPSPADVMAFWDEILEEYDELVYIPMSSGLSSSLETAAMLAQDYDGRVQVVNNQRISVTQRQSTIDACYLAKTGKSALQIKEILEADKFESSIYIMVDTLKYLKKGGRVTAAGAAIGAVLRIKPVLQIQGEKLDAFAKARGTKLGKKIMLDAMQADITERFAGKKMQLALAYTCSESEALEWKHEIEARFPDYEIVADRLSLSVACHIGPGALAIACAIDESQVEH